MCLDTNTPFSAKPAPKAAVPKPSVTKAVTKVTGY